jgi:hypothetical protein
MAYTRSFVLAKPGCGFVSELHPASARFSIDISNNQPLGLIIPSRVPPSSGEFFP